MEDYGQLVDRENINREEGGVDASGMEAAIAALVVGDSTPEDRHPEKYAAMLCRDRAIMHFLLAWNATYHVTSGMAGRIPSCFNAYLQQATLQHWLTYLAPKSHKRILAGGSIHHHSRSVCKRRSRRGTTCVVADTAYLNLDSLAGAHEQHMQLGPSSGSQT